MKYVIALIAAMSIFPAFAQEQPTPKPEEQKVLACSNPEVAEKYLNGQGYVHLLDVVMDNGTRNQFWTGGKSFVITFLKDDKLCLAATGSDVVFNPATIEKILDVWKRSQKDL